MTLGAQTATAASPAAATPDAKTLNAEGDQYFKLGQFDKAQTCYEAARKLEEKNIDPLNKQGSGFNNLSRVADKLASSVATKKQPLIPAAPAQPSQVVKAQPVTPPATVVPIAPTAPPLQQQKEDEKVAAAKKSAEVLPVSPVATPPSSPALLIDAKDLENIKGLQQQYNALLTHAQFIVQQVDSKALAAVRGHAPQLSGVIKKQLGEEHAALERELIMKDDKLDDYYHVFIMQFTSMWFACHSIHSGLVLNSKKNLGDYFAQGVNELGKHIPGVSVITDIVQKLMNGWSAHEKAQAVNRIAAYFSDMQTAGLIIEVVARHLTLTLASEIQKLAVQKLGVFKKIAKGLKALKDVLTDNDIDNVIRELAADHCQKILDAIVKGTLKPHPTVKDIDLLLGTALVKNNFCYQSPVKLPEQAATSAIEVVVRPSVAPLPATAAVLAGASLSMTINSPTTAELLAMIKEQERKHAEEVAALQRKLAKVEAAQKDDEDEVTVAGSDSAQAQVRAQKSAVSQSAAARFSSPIHLQSQLAALQEQTQHISLVVAQHNDALRHHDDTLAQQQALLGKGTANTNRL